MRFTRKYLCVVGTDPKLLATTTQRYIDATSYEEAYQTYYRTFSSRWHVYKDLGSYNIYVYTLDIRDIYYARPITHVRENSRVGIHCFHRLPEYAGMAGRQVQKNHFYEMRSVLVDQVFEVRTFTIAYGSKYILESIDYSTVQLTTISPLGYTALALPQANIPKYGSIHLDYIQDNGMIQVPDENKAVLLFFTNGETEIYHESNS